MGHKLADIQRIQSIFVSVYLLELVGATVVTSLGWAVCRILQMTRFLLPLFGLLAIYSYTTWIVCILIRRIWLIFRFAPRKAGELRAARITLAFLSAAVLLVWSLLTGRWWLVLALPFAAAILQFYSRPVPGVGFRLKDLPDVKPFLPPGVIAGILAVWPCVENGRGFRLRECLVFVWCLLLLTINSLVFDYCYIEGDSAVETQTVPVRLGRRNTPYLLIGLA